MDIVEITDPAELAKLNGTAPKTVAKPNAAGNILEDLSGALKGFRDASKSAQHGFANAATLGAYDKYLSPNPLTKEEEQAHPIANMAGTVAGTVIPATGVSRALQGIRGLGGTGILSNAANQALTSGALSAGEQAVQGETPSVGDTGLAAILGAGGGGIGAALGKLVSSGVRVADASKGIDAATKRGIKDTLDLGERHGVKLSIPQAAEAVNPGGEVPTAIDALYGASKSAAQEANNAFSVAQKNALPKAIESIKDEARTASAPFYKQTENILFPGMPTAGSSAPMPTKQAFAEVVSKLQNDPVTGSLFRGRAAHSGMVSDAARKELQSMGESMFEKHPLKSKLYRDASQDIYGALKQNPHYARADDIWTSGMNDADKIKDAVSSGMTKTGGSGGTHGLMGTVIQHPFVVGGALGALGGGVEGARHDGVEGALSHGAGGLAIGLGLAKADNRARRRVVEKLLDSNYVDKLGKHPKTLDAINAILQGLQSFGRN